MGACAPIAQLEEALVLETRGCGYLLTETLRERLPLGVWVFITQLEEALVLKTRGRGYLLTETLRERLPLEHRYSSHLP